MCPNSHNVLCYQGGRDPLIHTHMHTHTHAKPPPLDLTQCLCWCRSQALIFLSNRPMIQIILAHAVSPYFFPTLLDSSQKLDHHCLHLPLILSVSFCLSLWVFFFFFTRNCIWVQFWKTYITAPSSAGIQGAWFSAVLGFVSTRICSCEARMAKLPEYVILISFCGN